MSKPKILVLASGTKTGGGSGFQEMVEYSRTFPPVLSADIAVVVSNHQSGGVFEKAAQLNIPFEHWDGPFTAEGYLSLFKRHNAEYTMCSGWLKFVHGLNVRKTINIHPGPLPDFGGDGMHGDHVHKAVIDAYHKGKITCSAVTMHFVDPNKPFDEGPIFFQIPVLIRKDDDSKSLGKRVNEVERAWQSFILNLVVHERIKLERISKKWVVTYSNSYLRFIIPWLNA